MEKLSKYGWLGRRATWFLGSLLPREQSCALSTLWPDHNLYPCHALHSRRSVRSQDHWQTHHLCRLVSHGHLTTTHATTHHHELVGWPHPWLLADLLIQNPDTSSIATSVQVSSTQPLLIHTPSFFPIISSSGHHSIHFTTPQSNNLILILAQYHWL